MKDRKREGERERERHTLEEDDGGWTWVTAAVWLDVGQRAAVAGRGAAGGGGWTWVTAAGEITAEEDERALERETVRERERLWARKKTLGYLKYHKTIRCDNVAPNIAPKNIFGATCRTQCHTEYVFRKPKIFGGNF